MNIDINKPERLRYSEIDEGVRAEVKALRAGKIETYESCQGGPGHAFPVPTVRFHGEYPEGFRALSVALCAGLRVAELRRVYSIEDGEPVGPSWELTFVPRSEEEQICANGRSC